MAPGGQPSGGQKAEDAAAVFMTSTYLILLAFFVVLTSLSRFEPAKSEEVLESVTRAFGTGPTIYSGTDGEGGAAEGLAAAAERFREIARLVQTSIALAKVEQVDPGRHMQITVPAESLFDNDRVRDDSAHLLTRIAQALRSPSGTFEHQVEFVSRDNAAHVGIRRAGALARALTSAGAPSRSVLIGVEEGDASRVRFVFRSTERGRDHLRPSREGA